MRLMLRVTNRAQSTYSHFRLATLLCARSDEVTPMAAPAKFCDRSFLQSKQSQGVDGNFKGKAYLQYSAHKNRICLGLIQMSE